MYVVSAYSYAGSPLVDMGWGERTLIEACDPSPFKYLCGVVSILLACYATGHGFNPGLGHLAIMFIKPFT